MIPTKTFFKSEASKRGKVDGDEVAVQAYRVGSIEESEQLYRFYNEFMSLESDLIVYSSKAGEWLSKHGDDLDASLSMDNDKSTRAMHMACLAPLCRGVNARTLSASVAMYTTLMILSPSMRKEAGIVFRDGFNKLNLNKMSNWVDRNIVNHGRERYTAETAACQQLSLTYDAYHKMRERNADGSLKYDANEVLEQYDNALKSMYKLAEFDGVDVDDINRSARIIAGKMMERNPSFGQIFFETANDLVIQSPPQKGRQAVSVGGGKYEMRDVMVWNGEFHEYDENNDPSYEFNGIFTPRKPVEDIAEHSQLMTSYMYDHLRNECVRNGAENAYQRVAKVAQLAFVASWAENSKLGVASMNHVKDADYFGAGSFDGALKTVFGKNAAINQGLKAKFFDPAYAARAKAEMYDMNKAIYDRNFAKGTNTSDWEFYLPPDVINDDASRVAFDYYKKVFDMASADGFSTNETFEMMKESFMCADENVRFDIEANIRAARENTRGKSKSEQHAAEQAAVNANYSRKNAAYSASEGIEF